MKDVWSAWEPVRADIQPEKAEIGVWNRTYRFEESVFPTGVAVGGEELLARPIELVGRYAGAVERRVSEASYFELEKSDERAVFQLASRMGNTVIDGRMTCDFDGFIEICFSVIPFWSFSKNGDNAPRLDKLYIDIPMKKRFARLYHYWPNAATSIIPDPNVVNADALDLIEETVKLGATPAGAKKWWLGELSREANAKGVSLEELDITPQAVADVERLIADGKLNDKLAKQTVAFVLKGEGTPEQVVEAHGFKVVSDDGALQAAVQEALDANPDVVEKLKGGNMKPMGAIIGAVMRATKGQADAKAVTKIVMEKIKG